MPIEHVRELLGRTIQYYSRTVTDLTRDLWEVGCIDQLAELQKTFLGLPPPDEFWFHETPVGFTCHHGNVKNQIFIAKSGHKSAPQKTG